jgi:acetyl esterase
MTGGSLDRYATGYFFTREVLKWTASLYTSGGFEPQHPEISPLYGEVTPKLAPALFIIAECDVLRDQAIHYAAKVRSAGVDVQCHYYRGMPHAFMAMAGALELGQQALQDSAQQLKQAFAKDALMLNKKDLRV